MWSGFPTRLEAIDQRAETFRGESLAPSCRVGTPLFVENGSVSTEAR